MRVEAHVGDARTFIANERRRFDVIFLDPPFGDDPVAVAAARAAPSGSRRGGFLYAEAARALAPPAGLRRLAPRQGGTGALSSFHSGPEAA